MTFAQEIALRSGMYKNKVKLNYLLASGAWRTYYCDLMNENTIIIPKLRKEDKASKLPKTIRITTKPCFNETNKIHEYHAVEGTVGTVDWFGRSGSMEDKEDRRLITQAIEAGERIAKANLTPSLFGALKEYENIVPILLIALQLITLAGIYVLLNP